jgi:hypothetical protein
MLDFSSRTAEVSNSCPKHHIIFTAIINVVLLISEVHVATASMNEPFVTKCLCLERHAYLGTLVSAEVG